MKLRFLGYGSAFMPDMGNTSAIYFNEGNLFIFDCGYTTYMKLINMTLLEQVKSVHIFISHMHSDHVSGLTDLAFYMYYMKNISVNVYTTENMYNDIKEYLRIADALKVTNIVIINSESRCINIDNIISVAYINSLHVQAMISYSFIINLIKENEIIFYSGDANGKCPSEEYDSRISILKFAKLTSFLLFNKNIDYYCIESTYYEKTKEFHYYVETLHGDIQHLKIEPCQVFIMHIDTIKLIEKVLSLGYKLVPLYNEEERIFNEKNIDTRFQSQL